jgi:Catechol dioxygenase N terminus
MTFVTEQNLTDLAIERWSNIPDPRLRQVMTSLVKHLHAFVRPSSGSPAPARSATPSGRNSS